MKARARVKLARGMLVSRVSMCRAIFVAFSMAVCLCAQNAPPVVLTVEGQGVPARTAPTDYQAKAAIGPITIAADFVGHSIPTSQGLMTSEDYVCIEVAFYGPGGMKVKLATDDFSIRINGKKQASPSAPFGMMMKSLKDPEWQPEVPEGPKSKGGGINTGGGGGAQGDPKPEPPKMPFPLRRAMEQKVLKATLAEGDRPVPQAGLIFFPYRGKDASIKNIEVIYSGAAGKATLVFEQ